MEFGSVPLIAPLFPESPYDWHGIRGLPQSSCGTRTEAIRTDTGPNHAKPQATIGGYHFLGSLAT
jgi:hypothetical protein